jgi:membrane fusion protein, multidrug efflux system
MPRRRTLAASAAAVLLLALAAPFAYQRLNGAGEAQEEESSTLSEIAATASSGFASDISIPVAGVAAARDTLVLAVHAAGQAEAWRRTVVTAQVAGRVLAVPVRESQRVGGGQAVLTIDPAEYRLAVDEAQAGLRDAEAKFREMMVMDGAIADAEVRAERERLFRARSGLEMAEVRLRRAELDLERTRLAAPYAGLIASIRVVPGQWVRPGDELMTVLESDPVRLEVQVLESEVALLQPGARTRVSWAAFPGEIGAGVVETLNPLVEGSARTARVTVRVPNPDGRILPGMYARVSLDARRLPDRVLVPRAALLERDRRAMLFVYEGDERGGRAKWRYVTPGLANDSVVEILNVGVETDSVRPGEVVLTEGHYTLIHDARVRVVENVSAAGGRPQ